MASGVFRVMSMRRPREGESREAQDRDESGMAGWVLGPADSGFDEHAYLGGSH
jgi:hypothetical protein